MTLEITNTLSAKLKEAMSDIEALTAEEFSSIVDLLEKLLLLQIDKEDVSVN